MLEFPTAHVWEASFVRSRSAIDLLCELDSISLPMKRGKDRIGALQPIWVHNPIGKIDENTVDYFHRQRYKHIIWHMHHVTGCPPSILGVHTVAGSL